MSAFAGVQVSLSVELTRVFGPYLLQQGQQAASAMMEWARKLRQTGSDAVVELDLAEVFGRGKIDPVLESQFRNAVMQPFTITPIAKDGKVVLSTGAGPTLSWKDNPYYPYLFSSAVQLSFLGWVSERTALAAALTQCLETRFEKEWSPLRSPGFAGIFASLESCSNETSGFNWTPYLEHVRSELSKIIPINNLNDPRDSLSFQPHILLGCLDFLYIIQRTPEERLIRIDQPTGILTIIVWAHHILGLNVSVIDPQANKVVEFRKARASESTVLITLNSSASSYSIAKHESEICLLSHDHQLLISIDPEKLSADEIVTAERLQLQGYGTILLCRFLDESLDTFYQEPNTPHLVVAAEVAIALACNQGRKAKEDPNSVSGDEIYDMHGVTSAQVYNAASLIFGDPLSPLLKDRLPYSEKRIGELSETLPMSYTPTASELPLILQERLANLNGLANLIKILICLASVKNLDGCSRLKLSVCGVNDSWTFDGIDSIKG